MCSGGQNFDSSFHLELRSLTILSHSILDCQWSVAEGFPSSHVTRKVPALHSPREEG